MADYTKQINLKISYNCVVQPKHNVIPRSEAV